MWQIVGPNGVTNTTGGVAVPLPEAPVPPDTAPRHAGVGATVQTAAQTTVHPAVRAVTAVDATRPVNFGPLKRLAADPRVTDILVTCDGAVWVERGLGIELEHPSIPLDSPAVVRRLAVQLCAQLGERLDDARPIADASGADGHNHLCVRSSFGNRDGREDRCMGKGEKPHECVEHPLARRGVNHT